MELKDLTFLAYKEKIRLLNNKMKKHKARIINDGGESYIFFDYSQIPTETEEKTLLAEELGHYHCNAYYTLNSNQEYINKQEYKAIKWVALNCIPPESILSCFKKRNM